MNVKEYAKIQRRLDKQVLEGTTSGWMEENVSQAVYNGGDKIKLPRMYLQNRGVYDRGERYSDSIVTCIYETLTLTQSMNARFCVDAIDVDEVGLELAAANVAAEFQRTRVIPRIDAYRYSKLAAIAGIRSSCAPYHPMFATALLKQLSEVRDIAGYETDVVIVMSRPVYDKLVFFGNTSLETLQFRQGSLEFPVKAINGTPIIPVPLRRMQTEYIFDVGEFVPSARAAPINWIICPKHAPIAIAKTDSVRITPPKDNQPTGVWVIDYCKFHDLIIPDNVRTEIAVSIDM